MYPALAVVAELRTRENPANSALLYVGRAGAIEERLAQQAQIPFQGIDAGGVRGLAPWTAVRNLSRLLRSISRVRAIIRAFKPDAVLATGGYVSAPVVWAAAAEHVPSVIYLPDLEPGWAVRATAFWATRVAVSFPEVVRHFSRGKAVVTGYPVRAEFFNIQRATARRAFQLDPDARTVTIFGGSRGAHHINQAVVTNLRRLAELAQLILITGRDDEEWATKEAQALSPELCGRVRVFGYLDERLFSALAAADVAIARAGASTLGEFPALGLPAVLVPYPYAGKHQERNARYLTDRGAAVQVDDAVLPQLVVPVLQSLFASSGKLEEMSRAARALSQPHAAVNIATLLDGLRGSA